MSSKNTIVFFYIMVAITLPLQVYAEESPTNSDTFVGAFEQGKAYISMRYRFENVDQADITERARASTLRTRLGFNTAYYQGLAGTVEVEDVQTIGGTLYNDTINGKTEYPVVADPDGTEINQAFLSYKPEDRFDFKGGRRLLVLDDARFIGDVDWRQNSQTFDGVDANFSPLENTKLFYGWIYQVNRIFGEDSEQGKFNSQNHLFNAHYGIDDNDALTGFAYLLDLDNADQLSSATYGGRWDGKTPLAEKIGAVYELSYAYQTDYADNAENYSASYYRIVPGIEFSPITFKVGWEVLESTDGELAFQTPLATLHKFNGWADKFTSTPVNGLDDRFIQLDCKFAELFGSGYDSLFTTRYHDFQAEFGSQDYGSEWDISWLQKLTDRYFAELKYANFSGEETFQDTEKFWISFGARFST